MKIRICNLISQTPENLFVDYIYLKIHYYEITDKAVYNQYRFDDDY